MKIGEIVKKNDVDVYYEVLDHDFARDKWLVEVVQSPYGGKGKLFWTDGEKLVPTGVSTQKGLKGWI